MTSPPPRDAPDPPKPRDPWRVVVRVLAWLMAIFYALFIVVTVWAPTLPD